MWVGQVFVVYGTLYKRAWGTAPMFFRRVTWITQNSGGWSSLPHRVHWIFKVPASGNSLVHQTLSSIRAETVQKISQFLFEFLFLRVLFDVDREVFFCIVSQFLNYLISPDSECAIDSTMAAWWRFPIYFALPEFVFSTKQKPSFFNNDRKKDETYVFHFSPL